MRQPLAILAAMTAAGLIHLASTEWGVGETARMLLGAVCLWGPFAALIFMTLDATAPNRGERLALSLTGSYAATALAFFGFSALGAGSLFPVSQCVAVAALICYAPWRVRLVEQVRQWRRCRFDWVLAVLIVATLLVSVRYRTAFDFSPANGMRHYRLYHDQTYHVALEYELQRHTPPLQQASQAGRPERAYHVFPHVSTMLLARYGGHDDMLRVQTTWSFVVMTVMICLALHYLVRSLAGATSAGHLAVALLFIFAIPFPPLITNPLGYFYCSIYPHTTSLLEPVVMTTPQMYSGMVVYFGIILGMAVVDRMLRQPASATGSGSQFSTASRGEIWRLLILLGIMTGAMLRFRAQTFLPLAPVFALLSLVVAWRTRDWRSLLGVAVAVVVAAALLLEMRQSTYRPGTAGLQIGFNALTWPGTPDKHNPVFQWWWLFWPAAQQVFRGVTQALPPVSAMWTWHVACILGFVLFQVVGLPLAVAATAYAMSRDARNSGLLFTLTTAGMVVGSLLGAMILKSGVDDSYSLAGQMLLHICWYAFPMLPLALWMAGTRIAHRTSWTREQWSYAAVVVVLLALPYQVLRGPSSLETLCWNMGFTLSPDEWSALQFLRENTPAESVVLMPLRPQPGLRADDPEAQQRLWNELQNFAICGSLSGRATFIEYVHSPNETEAASERDRVRQILELWHTSEHADFAERLARMPVTHLVEYMGSSPECFRDGPPPCLEHLWGSAVEAGRVRIWRIRR